MPHLAGNYLAGNSAAAGLVLAAGGHHHAVRLLVGAVIAVVVIVALVLTVTYLVRRFRRRTHRAGPRDGSGGGDEGGGADGRGGRDAPPAGAAITVRHLTKTYRLGSVPVRALDDVSLEIPAGAMVAVMGKSGSGKSTLLRQLGLIDTPTSGAVWLGRREVTGMPERERTRLRLGQLGYVFQEYALLPELTAAENVYLPAMMRGGQGRRYRERAAELLDLVGLAGRARHRPRALSGGEQQRVAIARALVNEPSVIFADEPTAAATTVLMMLLIYVSLLFLPALIQGAVNRVNSQLVDTLTSDVVITPAGSAPSIDDAGGYLAKIRQTAGVAQATAVDRIGTQVSYGASSGSWTVDAIDPVTYGQVFTTPSNIAEGRALTTADTSQVLLGIGVAGAGQASVRGYQASLKSVHAGDKVAITLTTGRAAAFTVAGIYDNQFPQSDDDAYITAAEAARLVPGSSDHATTIYVKTSAGADVGQVVQRLTALRGGMKFNTSADLGATVEDQVATFNLISDILKVISLAMAAVTIFIVTYIDLLSRGRQIGIERAIGIGSAPIVASYVAKACAYALAGIGAGLLLLRYAVTPAVGQHPFHFPNGPVTLAATWGEMSRDLVILIVVAILAALIPSLRSVQVKILDAIWGST